MANLVMRIYDLMIKTKEKQAAGIYIYIHSLLCTSYSYWLNTEFSQDWCQASLAVSKEGVQLKTKAYIAPEGFLANITDPTGANQFFCENCEF